MGVLGCALLSPNDVLDELAVKFKGAGAKVFYDLRHETIYEVMQAMRTAGEVPDVITLQQRLKDKNLLAQVGGIAYLSALPDAVPSAANLSYYADIVFEKYVLRSVVHTCTDVVGRIYDYEGEVDELMDEVEREILTVGNLRRSAVVRPTAKALVRRAIDNIELLHQRQGKLGGLPTGFIDLDKMLDGLHPGELVIIAGYQSMGKTSLALNIATTLAIEHAVPVGIFSYEMTADELMKRMVCSRAMVNLRNVQEGFLAERDFPKLTGAASKLSKASIHIDDDSDAGILELRAKARRMVSEHGIKLFVGDYLQAIPGQTKRKDSTEEQEISSVALGFKRMAKELGVAAVLLAALGDRGEAKGKIRGSGAVGYHADTLLILERDKEQDEEEELENDVLPVVIRIRKQRNGPTGNVHLNFLRSFTRFENAAKVSDEDVPEQGRLEQ